MDRKTNILIVNDDGPYATGLMVLLDALESAIPGIKPTVIVPSEAKSGQGMALTHGKWQTFMEEEVKTVYPREDRKVLTLDLSPADIVYRAFYDRERFTNRPWDLVISGVNHGANVGFDLYHSGTVGAALVAASGLGCCSMALSQDVSRAEILKDRPDQADESQYSVFKRAFTNIARQLQISPGMCYNVNFPEKVFNGFESARAAHYSYHRVPPTSVVPRARDEKNDISTLCDGYVTVTELQLRSNKLQGF